MGAQEQVRALRLGLPGAWLERVSPGEPSEPKWVPQLAWALAWE
jgi:hypothetical protein